MTQAQIEAGNRIRDIMREHFDAAVIVISCDSDDEDNGEVELPRIIWHGGFYNAIGLVEATQSILLTRSSQRVVEPGDDEDE